MLSYILRLGKILEKSTSFASLHRMERMVSRSCGGIAHQEQPGGCGHYYNDDDDNEEEDEEEGKGGTG